MTATGSLPRGGPGSAGRWTMPTRARGAPKREVKVLVKGPPHEVAAEYTPAVVQAPPSRKARTRSGAQKEPEAAARETKPTCPPVWTISRRTWPEARSGQHATEATGIMGSSCAVRTRAGRAIASSHGPALERA